MDYPYVATSIINRKETQTRTCRTARDLAATLIPQDKTFNWRRWTITKHGQPVDINRFEGCGGDWIGRVNMLARIIETGQ